MASVTRRIRKGLNELCVLEARRNVRLRARGAELELRAMAALNNPRPSR